MVQLKSWRIKCNTTGDNFYVKSVNQPLECPNNSGHSISVTKLNDDAGLIPDRLFTVLSTNYALVNSLTTIPFDTVSFSNTSNLTINNGIVTFNRSGDYLISYTLTPEIVSGNRRTLITSFVEKNAGIGWSLVTGSKSFTSIHTLITGKQTYSNIIPVHVNVNDQLRIVSSIENDSDVIINYEASSLQIKSIDE